MRKFFIAATVAVISLVASGPTAQAAFQMTLQSGASTLTIVDNDGNDNNSAVGQIGYNLAFGDFDRTNIQSATSNSSYSEIPAQLSLTTQDVTTHKAGASLTITLEDDGFNVPLGQVGVLSELSNTQISGGAINNATLTYRSFVNGVGGTTVGTNQPAGTVWTDTATIGSAPYDLKGVLTIQINSFSGSTASVQGTALTSVATPAPAGLVLALTGMPMLGLGAWVRRRRLATAA